MGYYSEVKIVMKESDYQEMKARVDYYTNKEDLQYFLEMATEKYHTLDKDTRLAIVHWDWVKWDAYYNKEVEFIYNYLRELNEQGKPYKMVRIGGDVDDIEILDSWGIDGDNCCDIIRAEVYAEIVEDFEEN